MNTILEDNAYSAAKSYALRGTILDQSTITALTESLDIDELITKSKKQKLQPIIFGTSNILMQLAQNNKKKYTNCIIIETGGTKGLTKEITKDEMYIIFKEKLQPTYIYS